MISKNRKSNTIKVSSLIVFIYSITVLIQVFTAKYENSGFMSQLKYIMFLATCGVCIFYMNKYKNLKFFNMSLRAYYGLLFLLQLYL